MARLLLITQVYVPDPASVGQHMADVAEEMARRGWEVTVLTSDRGYEDPRARFPARERLRGVAVRRLRWSSMGKRTILHRLAGQAAFCGQALARALVMPRPDVILVTTSPPMGGAIGLVAAAVRRSALCFWAMDLNPDQAIAQGVVSEKSVAARLFEWFNRRLLRRADPVVAPDCYMAERLDRKVPLGGRIHVLPPWPMEGYLELVAHDDNPFRREHELEGKFVFMYSGNHSPVHPLDTVLEASRAFRGDERVRFLFVGGGKGKTVVEEFIRTEEPGNVVSLPYQPLEKIKYSLSAADVHLVSMGNAMVGCVHPCKFYGALALGKPIVALGPERSHLGDVIKAHPVGWRVDHGDLEGAERVLRECVAMPEAGLRARGAVGRALVDTIFGKKVLCGRFCELLEQGAGPEPPTARPCENAQA